MELVKPHPQIYLFLGETPADLGRPFLRLAEFYESPSKRFRRRYFTVAAFERWYRRTQNPHGRFSYFTDYFGYNVPGDVVQEWAVTYAGRETEEEQRLLTLLGPTPDRFYVIGAPRSSAATVDHELAHAFFHLFPDYREAMERLMAGEDLRAVHRYLKANMYATDVYADEASAYLMFDEALLHRSGVSTRHLRAARDAMRSVYEHYKKCEIEAAVLP